jgi:hypothetical protein
MKDMIINITSDASIKFHKPFHRGLTIFLFLINIFVQLVFLIFMLFHRPIPIEGVIFFFFALIATLFATYLASRSVIMFQMNESGINLWTITTDHFIPTSDIYELILRHSRFYGKTMFVLTIIRRSNKKKSNFRFNPRNFKEVAPTNFETIFIEAVNKFKIINQTGA